MQMKTLVFSLLTYVILTPALTPGAPVVTLNNGTFTGTSQGLINTFLGIPFAKPPVGDLRFRLPVAPDPYEGAYNATAFGPACPQQVPPNFIPPGFEVFQEVYEAELSNPLGDGAEDCLTLNVWTPASVLKGKKLPVVAWISGGGFEEGGTSTVSPSNDPTALLNRSIELQEPFVFVSMNYRVSTFGFLAGNQVLASNISNIGLHDQRLALRWIQTHIAAFSGDASRVILVGWSAGAISIAMHMLDARGTEGLFRAAWMGSGGPVPVGSVVNGQEEFDRIVNAVGCAGARDEIECLRGVEYEKLKEAQDSSPSVDSYSALNLAWTPRADGVFWPEPFQRLALEGKVADIPFISGNVNNEGTAFTMWDANITTEPELRTFLATNYLPHASASELNTLLSLYPEEPSPIPPLSAQFKRLATFHGDLAFQIPRRLLLRRSGRRAPAWSFLSKVAADEIPLGSAHGTDLPFFLSGAGRDYIIRFVSRLNPNGDGSAVWPSYTAEEPRLLTVYDAPAPVNVTEDSFREAQMRFLGDLSLREPL